ncbi:hypothetical protein MMC18_000334 [Xylographa bjoerkii]|nr:hypothetical protein [Xylographa bjoerkii]
MMTKYNGLMIDDLYDRDRGDNIQMTSAKLGQVVLLVCVVTVDGLVKSSLARLEASIYTIENEIVQMDAILLSSIVVGESTIPDCEEYRSMTRSDAWSLYVSHALSTWNARSYEFAAILFTAAAFPDTLLASSIRGLCNTVAALCLSSWIGRWIDRSQSRLRTLLLTISANRASAVLACLVWYMLVRNRTPADHLSYSNLLIQQPTALMEQKLSLWLFALVISLGIVEKISGIGNMICMERDWVPILASTADDEPHNNNSLTHLNAVMRLVILVTSTPAGIALVGLMSTVSWGAEVYCARRVWDSCHRLRKPKGEPQAPSVATDDTCSGQRLTRSSPALDVCRKQWSQFSDYFSTDVWFPSLSLALLHLSVLSYSATFVTFCLNSGFSLLVITIARAAGSVVEVSSTFIAPFGVNRLAIVKGDPDQTEDHQGLLESLDPRDAKEHAVGLARSGLWGLILQLVTLVPVVLAIWHLTRQDLSPAIPGLLSRFLGLASPFTSQPLAAVLMFLFLSLSRLGLWVFDLTTQEITQTGVQHRIRSSFAGTEMAFVSFFELGQWVIAAIVSKPEHFRWLALGSLGAVMCSTCMYAWWVRGQRGHLMHWDRLVQGCYCAKVLTT